MTSKDTPQTVSDCCGAGYHVEGSYEGTSGYYCDKCGKNCWFVSKNQGTDLTAASSGATEGLSNPPESNKDSVTSATSGDFSNPPQDHIRDLTKKIEDVA